MTTSPPPPRSSSQRGITITIVAASVVLVVLAGLWLAARRTPRATTADCQALLDAIVALELREQGYDDPVLRRRRQAQLSKTLAGSLDACVGRRLPPNALECAGHARSSEELSHRCLR